MKSLEEFYDELSEYFDSKIPDVDIAVRKELAIFVIYRVAIRERDLTEGLAQQFRDSFRGAATTTRRALMERNKELTEQRRSRINYAEEVEKKENDT